MADATPAPEIDPATPAPAAPVETPPVAPKGEATPPAKAPASLVEADDTDDAPPAAPQNWPDDWREKYAGADEKKLKQLQRYASPQAALDALFSAQQKIRSGEMKSALPENPTPEELTKWRAENGIPESPDKYELNLPSGLVLGDDDKPVVDDFLKAAHEANMHPAQVAKALDWYFSKQEEVQRAQDEFDAETRAAGENALRAEFGGEYKANMQAVRDLLAGAPEGIKEQLLGGRLADGTPVGNSPDVIRWLVGIAREINPAATVVPGSGANAMQAMESELADIEKMMGDYNSDYWKGPKSAQLQARYDELVRAKQKYGARQAA